MFPSDRMFQVWFFTPSHSQLLLRSSEVDELGTRKRRLEVVFRGVAAMYLPTFLKGLKVEPLGEDACRSLLVPPPPTNQGETVFRCVAGRFEGWVVAEGCAYAADDGDFWEGSDLLGVGFLSIPRRDE